MWYTNCEVWQAADLHDHFNIVRMRAFTVPKAAIQGCGGTDGCLLCFVFFERSIIQIG